MRCPSVFWAASHMEGVLASQCSEVPVHPMWESVLVLSGATPAICLDPRNHTSEGPVPPVPQGLRTAWTGGCLGPSQILPVVVFPPHKAACPAAPAACRCFLCAWGPLLPGRGRTWGLQRLLPSLHAPLTALGLPPVLGGQSPGLRDPRFVRVGNVGVDAWRTALGGTCANAMCSLSRWGWSHSCLASGAPEPASGRPFPSKNSWATPALWASWRRSRDCSTFCHHEPPTTHRCGMATPPETAHMPMCSMPTPRALA